MKAPLTNLGSMRVRVNGEWDVYCYKSTLRTITQFGGVLSHSIHPQPKLGGDLA